MWRRATPKVTPKAGPDPCPHGVKGTYHRLKLVGLAPRAERNHAFHRALVELR
jgi:hypothetical protein